MQQHASSAHVMAPACGVLDAWLKTATDAIAVSPASRPAATVRQQLQDLRPLEHLGAGMDAAAASLTIAAAAVTAASSSSSRAAPKPLAKELSIVQLLQAECCCDHLLKTLDLASRMMSPTGDFIWEAALPATAGAVRLVLTGFFWENPQQAAAAANNCYRAARGAASLQQLFGRAPRSGASAITGSGRRSGLPCRHNAGTLWFR